MDRIKADLQYGHGGRSHYDSNDRVWRTEHSTGSRSQAYSIAGPELCLSGVTEDTSTENSSRRDYANQARFWRELKRTDPLCTPAVSAMHRIQKQTDAEPCLEISASSSSSTTFDTTLITDFGSQPPLRYRILAYPSGAAGDCLAVAVCLPVQRGWKEDTARWLNADVPNDSTVSLWSPHKGPICQVSFQRHSINDDADPILMVRFPTSIATLKLVLRERAKSVEGWRPSSLFPLGLDRRTYPLTIVSIDDHVADAAMHYEDPHLIAVVMSHGVVNVLRIEKHVATERSSERLATSHKTESIAQNAMAQASKESWRRIFWTQASQVLVVMSQEGVSTYCMNGRHLRHTDHDALRDSYTTVKIWAACQHPSASTVLVVVTASCVHVLQVLECNDSHELRELLRWKHFHDFKGTSVDIKFVKDTSDSLLLTVPRLGIHVHLHLKLISLSRSGHFEASLWPVNIDTIITPFKPISSVTCTRIQLSASRQATTRSKALHFRRDELQFYAIFVIDEANDMWSWIYPSAGRERPTPCVGQLSWESKRQRFRPKGSRIVYEPFVVDSEDHEIEDLSAADYLLAQTTLDRFHKLSVPKNVGNSRQSDYKQIYHDCFSTAASVLTFDEASMGTENENAAALGMPRTRLGIELFGEIPSVANIDSADEVLSQWVHKQNATQFGPQQAVHRHAETIGFPLLKALRDGEHGTDVINTSISDAYRACLQTWLQPMPPEVPNVCRLARERVARFTAAALVLSTLRREPARHVNGDASVHVRPTEPKTPPASNAMPSSPPVPQDGNSDEASLSPAKKDAYNGLRASAVDRLSKFINIEGPMSPNGMLESVFSDLLQSWNIGQEANPATLRRFEGSEGGMALSAEARARELRRLEKRKQAEERRAQIQKKSRVGAQLTAGFGTGFLSSPGRASTQLGVDRPANLQDSAPAHMAAESWSSQLEANLQPHEKNVASQIEPGRHGGRPEGITLRKKTRRPGF